MRLIALAHRPDKPVGGGTPEVLARLEQIGGYVAQAKHDGYRATVTREGVFSRAGKRLDVHPLLAPGVAELLALYPPGEVALDGELLPDHKGGPGLYLYDLTVVGGAWLGSVPYEERLARLRTGSSEWITTPAQVAQGFVAFFLEQLGKTEGVVCKRLDSGLVGSAKRSAINPAWTKARHDQQLGGIR